jgi:cytochrome c oxidase subunit 1
VDEAGPTAGEQAREVERQEEVHQEIHLPPPSIWPLIMAAGITFLLFGLVTNLVFSAVGVLLIVAALGGWIGESLHA